MTEEQPLTPRVQPPPRRAGRSQKPSRTHRTDAPEQADEHRLEQPLAQIAPNLEPPWFKEDTDTPERTTLYTHPEGHRIGLRLQSGGLIIQSWITAGPDLPPIPAGTAEEKADAQAANDARLQPGRSWHATVTTRHPEYVRGLLGAVIRHQLIPALSNKPKRVPTATAQPEAEHEKKTATAENSRTTTKNGTQK
ncbi:hypothetical protein [Streptomyces gossypiisoli]|uniref:hypothetical protein n=1 Tax=Streptomyces gossypiisoli TaxID=2748864 RepID=UPI0015D99E23|nr:hypothetical protein [Streptomyces gossypiisoli]